jgi:dienelactone hydrolase
MQFMNQSLAKPALIEIATRARRAVQIGILLGAAALIANTSWSGEQPLVYPPAEQVRKDFLKQLDRPRIALDPRIQKTQADAGGRIVENISIASERKADGSIERVPILLVRPAAHSGRLPAVIALHGTGGNKESLRGLLVEFSKRGMIGVAIDARYHGARSGGERGSQAYVAAITRAWQTPPGQSQEHPFYFDTCWDIWRTIDYLQTRPDVDGERLGMIGFSMGGIETWLAAAVDERVKVAVPAIGVQSFRWSLEHEAWRGRARTIEAAHDVAARDLGEPQVNARVCRELWNKVIPGMLDEFDCPSMIRLFAGRPLLILNGDHDPNCPLGGAKIAFAAAETAFREAGASDKLKIMLAADTGHKVTTEQRQAAIEWLTNWLKRP